MRDALSEAEVGSGDVGCVVPHGTGTPLNDVVESRALGVVLGDRAGTVPVYSLKAMLWAHRWCGRRVRSPHRRIDHRPPNRATDAPLESPDPACALRLHTGEPLRGPVDHVLVNAYAFGGNNISVLLGRPR